MTQLGTMEELPKDYVETLSAGNLLPLWPALRSLLPHGKPERACQPMSWQYSDVRPLLMRAGELTPIEKAERRVLVLANPSLGAETAWATPSIYIGLQLILPGETAPNHRHSPSAVRFVVEGEGGFTVVDGEKLPMEKGDLILTPSGLWHEHGHTGTGPVVWLDALDLPLVHALDASYCIEGPSQILSNLPDRSQRTYRRAGLVPYKSLSNARANYPLVRYPWKEVRAALDDMAAFLDRDETAQLAYVNPETGLECLPVLGFSALALRPGETYTPARCSASKVLHIIEGEGDAVIDGKQFTWSQASTIAVPTHADIALYNRSPRSNAYIFVIDDAPMQRKLGFYEEF